MGLLPSSEGGDTGLLVRALEWDFRELGSLSGSGGGHLGDCSTWLHLPIYTNRGNKTYLLGTAPGKALYKSWIVLLIYVIIFRLLDSRCSIALRIS